MKQQVKSKIDAFIEKMKEEAPVFTDRKKFFVRKETNDVIIRLVPEHDGTSLRLFGLHYINDDNGNLLGTYYCPTLTSLLDGDKNPAACPVCDYISEHKDNEHIKKWMAQKRPVAKIIDLHQRERGPLFWDMSFQNATRLSALISEYPHVVDPEEGELVYVKIDRDTSKYPEYHFSILLTPEGEAKKAPIDLGALPEVGLGDAFGTPTNDFIKELSKDTDFDFGYNAAGTDEKPTPPPAPPKTQEKPKTETKEAQTSLSDFMKTIGVKPKE